MMKRGQSLPDWLLLGKLSETVVVHGNAPHDRPRFLVCRLVCTEAPMLRVSKSNFLDGHQID
jgi:hypothetical protein